MLEKEYYFGVTDIYNNTEGGSVVVSTMVFETISHSSNLCLPVFFVLCRCFSMLILLTTYPNKPRELKRFVM